MTVYSEILVCSVSCQAQLAGKEREIEQLRREAAETKRQYEEIYGTKLEDLAEVRIYSGLIVPEIARLTK